MQRNSAATPATTEPSSPKLLSTASFLAASPTLEKEDGPHPKCFFHDAIYCHSATTFRYGFLISEKEHSWDEEILMGGVHSNFQSTANIEGHNNGNEEEQDNNKGIQQDDRQLPSSPPQGDSPHATVVTKVVLAPAVIDHMVSSDILKDSYVVPCPVYLVQWAWYASPFQQPAHFTPPKWNKGDLCFRVVPTKNAPHAFPHPRDPTTPNCVYELFEYVEGDAKSGTLVLTKSASSDMGGKEEAAGEEIYQKVHACEVLKVTRVLNGGKEQAPSSKKNAFMMKVLENAKGKWLENIMGGDETVKEAMKSVRFQAGVGIGFGSSETTLQQLNKKHLAHLRNKN